MHLLLSLVLVSFLAVPSLSLAQNTTTSVEYTPDKAIEPVRGFMPAKKDGLKRIFNQKEASQEALIEKEAEERIGVWKERQEFIKKQIEEKREANKQIIEKKRELLKEKLEGFTNKKKAEIAEKIDKNLNLINEKHTKAMSAYLDRLGNIVEKLEKRVAEAKAAGKDTAEAEKAIKEAKDSISAAGEAVAAQAGKDYTLTVTDETKVRIEAKNMRDKLHADLQATRKIVIQAKQALSNAIRVSAQSLGGKNED